MFNNQFRPICLINQWTEFRHPINLQHTKYYIISNKLCLYNYITTNFFIRPSL